MAKESYYQKKIIDKLTKDGYFVINLIKTNRAGISDLIAVKPNDVFFIECKTPTGKLSELQKYRLEELKNKGFKVAVSYGDDIRKFREENKHIFENN